MPDCLFCKIVEGTIPADRAVALKREQMDRIVAVQQDALGRARFVEFELDTEWLSEIERGF